MRIILALVFLTCIITPYVYGNVINPKCVVQAKTATSKCIRRGPQIFDEIKKLRKKEISLAEYIIGAESICTFWHDTSICNVSLDGVDNECLQTPVFSSFVNAYKILVASNEWLCKNSAEKYLQIGENDGAVCMETNPEEKACTDALKKRLAINGTPMINENICEYIDGQIACAQHYESCENKHIQEITIELFNNAKAIIEC